MEQQAKVPNKGMIVKATISALCPIDLNRVNVES